MIVARAVSFAREIDWVSLGLARYTIREVSLFIKAESARILYSAEIKLDAIIEGGGNVCGFFLLL